MLRRVLCTKLTFRQLVYKLPHSMENKRSSPCSLKPVTSIPRQMNLFHTTIIILLNILILSAHLHCLFQAKNVVHCFFYQILQALLHLHACHTPCPSYPYYLITLVISGDDYTSLSFLLSISLQSCVTHSYLDSNIFFSTRSSKSHWAPYFEPPSVEVDRERSPPAICQPLQKSELVSPFQCTRNPPRWQDEQNRPQTAISRQNYEIYKSL